MDDAFSRLRAYARNHNLRPNDVARQVVETDLAVDVLAAHTTDSPARRNH